MKGIIGEINSKRISLRLLISLVHCGSGVSMASESPSHFYLTLPRCTMGIQASPGTLLGGTLREGKRETFASAVALDVSRTMTGISEHCHAPRNIKKSNKNR